VIVNCDIGVAVKDLSAARLDQNTFYNVGVPVSCFEKNIGLGGGNSLVTNSIFSNSSSDPIRHDAISQIIVTTSLSDTDSLPKTLNFFGNPFFVNPSFNDFSLMSESIAIDAGTDDDGNIVNLGARPNPYVADPSLMISKIQYFPQGNQDAEFITLYNPSDKTIDLEGYILADAIDFVFPPETNIEADETILIAKDKSLVDQGIDKEYTWTRGRLSNEGENIDLIAPSGIVEDHVRYDNKAPWPLEAEGNGAYLQLIDPILDNHFAESWESNLNTSTDDKKYPNRNIKIFPNPAKDFITIESPREIIEKLEVINALGQEVISSIHNSSSITINIDNLNSGIYFIRVNGLMDQISVIIQK